MSYGNKGGGYQKRSGSGSKYGSKKPYNGERKQMHDATCSTCGADCKVPFRPSGDRPILCSQCFEQKNEGGFSGTERRFESRDRKPSFDRKAPMVHNRPDPQIAELKGELRTMHSKLDRIMQMLGDKKVVPEDLYSDTVSVSPIKKSAMKKKAKKETKEIISEDILFDDIV